MSEQSLVLLRLCLLALVHLVFLRVPRALWVEFRAEQGLTVSKVAGRLRTFKDPRTSKSTCFTGDAPAATDTNAAGGLLLVAPPASADRKFTLSAESTLGGAPGCGVQNNDRRVSELCARLLGRQGEWCIEDPGSTDGTRLNGEEVAAPTLIERGGRIQVAETGLVLT